MYIWQTAHNWISPAGRFIDYSLILLVWLYPSNIGSSLHIAWCPSFTFCWACHLRFARSHVKIYTSEHMSDMVINIKVLVKSFNCEGPSCYVGNLRQSFSRARESNMLICESFSEIVVSALHMLTTCKGLPPGLQQEKGTGEIRYGSGFSEHCVVLHSAHLPFPSWFIGGCRASKGEALPQPEAHLLALPNIAFWSLNKNTPHAAAELPKVRLCQSQTPKPLVFAFPLMCPCWKNLQEQA